MSCVVLAVTCRPPHFACKNCNAQFVRVLSQSHSYLWLICYTCTLLFSVHVMLVVALTDSWWKVALFCLFMLSAAKKRRNFFIIHNTEPELELWKVLVSLQCGGCFWVCISKGVKSTCALVCWGLCLCLIEQHCSCSHSHLSVISFNSTPTFTCSCYFLKKI